MENYQRFEKAVKFNSESVISVPFFNVVRIKYYKFHILENQGVYHAIFTSHGGIFSKPWESLNFGASVGDDIAKGSEKS